MKYIDADLLRGKISEQMESLPREVGRGTGTITSKGYGMMEAFQIIRSIIDSLQEEQPSLPSNLDEAAEKYAIRGFSSNADPYEETIAYQADKDAFKAGAEWMAGQGVMDSIEGTVCGRVYDHINIRYTDDVGITLKPRNISHIPVDVNKYKIGDKVIVQIRKKDD